MIAAPSPAGARPAASRRPRRQPPAWALTAVFGLLYVILAPSSPDLATASYRSHLFAVSGLTIWDNGWYGGHHLLAYSLLSPALGALLGPRLLAAASMTLATALFAALIAERFPRRATQLAAYWFAFGASIALLSCRVAFDLGIALALGALLAAQRGRWWAAFALTVLTSLASPVAGAFLALALVAWGLAGPPRRALALALAALLPIALLALAFPEGGTQPFVGSAFYPALAAVLVIGLLIGPEHRALRVGAALYAAALVGAFLIPTAVGGNVDRLGALLAGPIAACVLVGASPPGRRGLIALALLVPLTYWQANAPVTDFVATVSDRATSPSYYAPLLSELRALRIGYAYAPARIEVVPGVTHWEARWVAPAVMLARGWERQLDRQRNGLFYDGAPLTAARYRAWLDEQAISYVALPDSPLDYSAKAEAALLRGGPPRYLREVWRSRHWRLFAVLGARPLAQPPARMLRADHDSFAVYAPAAGDYTVRLRFTPYWALASGRGCVARAPGGWTRLATRGAGTERVVIDFSLARVFDHGPRCR